jgi:hypothetical protein
MPGQSFGSSNASLLGMVLTAMLLEFEPINEGQELWCGPKENSALVRYASPGLETQDVVLTLGSVVGRTSSTLNKLTRTNTLPFSTLQKNYSDY